MRASEDGRVTLSNFAPLWLYFDFYLLCRRQERFPGWVKDPSFTARAGLGAVMALPWLVLILAIDQYVHFLNLLSRAWMAIGLPGTEQKAWGYVLVIVTFFTGVFLFASLFGGGYVKIRQAFSAYDRSEHALAPAMVSLLVWIAMIWVSIYALMSQASVQVSNNLVLATLINFGIFIFAEIMFRFWWRWWCKNQQGA